MGQVPQLASTSAQCSEQGQSQPTTTTTTTTTVVTSPGPCAQAYKIYGSGGFGACLWSNALANVVADRLVCADFSRGVWLVYNGILRDSVLVAFSANAGSANASRKLEAAVGRWACDAGGAW